MPHTFAGAGPGAQTPDGCSVALYRSLPYLGELEEVIDCFAPGASVLELGCGTGRLCARLLERGCVVTGVDESPEMLAHLPPGVRGVVSTIEHLDAGTQFDVVLLASHLINHPEAEVRAAFVRCARRHLRAGGTFLLRRHSVDWLIMAAVGPAGRAGGSRLHVEAVTREAGVVSMRLRYELGGQVWTHAFATVPLHEPDVEQLLQAHGFAAVQWMGAGRLWGVARAVGNGC